MALTDEKQMGLKLIICPIYQRTKPTIFPDMDHIVNSSSQLSSPVAKTFGMLKSNVKVLFTQFKELLHVFWMDVVGS